MASILIYLINDLLALAFGQAGLVVTEAFLHLQSSSVSTRGSRVSPHVVVIFLLSGETSFLGHLSRRLAAEHSDARAEAEGQEEAALADEEDAEHVAVFGPARFIIVHVRVGHSVLSRHRVALFTAFIESEHAGEDDAYKVGHLRDLHAREHDLEQLAVDETREAAHNHAAEHGVDDGVELEHELPVRVERAVQLVAHIVVD